MTQDNKKYYLHYDQVGSLRTVTDTSHNIIKEVSYDTFGTILTDSNPSFSIPFGFAGGLYDTDTKLTRFGYRDYDAYTGKWTAKDPIDFAGGDSNLYGYVLGDPVGFVDPKGLRTAIDDIQDWIDLRDYFETLEEYKNAKTCDDKQHVMKEKCDEGVGNLPAYECYRQSTIIYGKCIESESRCGVVY